MTTATLVKKLNREIGVLQKDIREIKKVVFAPIRDSEGEYRPSFVKKVMRRMNERGALYRFTTKEAFLKHVRSTK